MTIEKIVEEKTKQTPKIKSYLVDNSILQFIHGSLLTLAFHPFDIFLVIPITFSWLLWYLEKECFRRFKSEKVTKKTFFKIGFKNSFIFFLGHFTTSMYWMASPLFFEIDKYWFLLPFAVLLLPAFLASFYGIASGFVTSRIILTTMRRYGPEGVKSRTHEKILISIYFALGFFLAEIIRSNFFLPFTWNLLGYATGYSLSLMQMASVTGVYGLSLLLYFVGTISYTRNLLAIATVIILVVIITLFGNRRLNQACNDFPHKEKLATLYVVQPNLEHHYHQYEKRIAAISKATGMVDGNALNLTSSKKIKLIVLPESAIPFTLRKNQDIVFDDLMSKYSQNSFLLAGVDRYDGSNYYNSMIAVDHDGAIVDGYDKITLAPFGEYIPWKPLLNFISKPIVGESYGYTSGASLRNITIYPEDPYGCSDPLVIIPMICFESIFTPLTHHRDNINANLIVNITNDSWLGNTIGPHQHFAMARMRAVEYGLPLIRAAKTGISAVIDSHGKIIQKINLNEEGVIVFEMPEDKVDTIYMRIARTINGFC